MTNEERAAECLKEIEAVLAKHNFTLIPIVELIPCDQPEKPEEDTPAIVDAEVVVEQ